MPLVSLSLNYVLLHIEITVHMYMFAIIICAVSECFGRVQGKSHLNFCLTVLLFPFFVVYNLFNYQLIDQFPCVCFPAD